MSEKPEHGATHLGHANPVSATLTAIMDRFSRGTSLPPLRDEVRIDGKLCLVTGANSGLGRAVATQLARRGGRLLLACRSGIPETAEAIRAETGNEAVEMLFVDLADLHSVHALCDQLKARGEALDIVVLNAGLMPRKARATKQGYEVMFGVHFLANRLLAGRLMDDGLFRKADASTHAHSRVIFVSSETHQSAPPIDFDRFSDYVDYGIMGGMAQYGASKLLMSTLAAELSRRLNPDGVVEVGVHSLCPGPINSSISREAPAVVKPLLSAVMGLMFNSPDEAAAPVMRLACDPSLAGCTGLYMHMMRDKSASPESKDPQVGARLWELSGELLAEFARV